VRIEVGVVGGGPGGAAAAIALARAGREVHLIDRATFPRDKTCGDGLTANALRRLADLGLDPSTVASWCEPADVVVRSPSGRAVRFPLPRRRGVFAAVARRVDLDAALVDLARASGVKVHDGHGLRGVSSVGRDSVTLDVDGLGPVEATYVVAADGQWSPTAKALGLYPSGYLGEWHAFRQYFTGTAAAARDLWVWFEPDILPGYAWSFPLPSGRANVGFGVQREAGVSAQAMKDLWPALLDRPHIRDVLGLDAGAVAESAHRAWPIPARIDTAVLAGAGGRVLFVGDAAGACDPMTGEGIGQALDTAAMAAAAIGEAGPGAPAWAAWRYRRDVWTTLRPDHQLSMLLVRALRHRKGARAAVRVAGATAWTRRNFARWLFEDEPRAALVTPHRWHRAFLRRDGARF
jgi:geranylgeranyl reductase family protein